MIALANQEGQREAIRESPLRFHIRNVQLETGNCFLQTISLKSFPSLVE